MQPGGLSGLDGDYWNSSGDRNKQTTFQPPKQKRKVSDGHSRGRPAIAFDDLSEITQERKLAQLHNRMLETVTKVLADEDVELAEAWKDRYGFFGTPTPESLLSLNAKELYDSLPQTSLIKTVLIKDLYKGYTQKEIVELLGLSQSRVSFALATETRPLSYYLSSLGIPRNRSAEAETHVLNWFLITCQVPSGRNRRCFLGTPTAMYFEYRTWCLQSEVRLLLTSASGFLMYRS